MKIRGFLQDWFPLNIIWVFDDRQDNKIIYTYNNFRLIECIFFFFYYYCEYSGVLFTLFLPVVILLVFDFSIGHSPKNVSMAVVNYEVLANCSNCPAKQVAVCPANLLSCQYMQYLKKYDMILVSIITNFHAGFISFITFLFNFYYY